MLFVAKNGLKFGCAVEPVWKIMFLKDRNSRTNLEFRKVRKEMQFGVVSEFRDGNLQKSSNCCENSCSKNETEFRSFSFKQLAEHPTTVLSLSLISTTWEEEDSSKESGNQVRVVISIC